MRKILGDTLSLSARVKATSLAWASIWLAEQGQKPRTRSDIVGLCVELVGSQLEKEKRGNLAQAFELLDSQYPVQTRIGPHVLYGGMKEERKKGIRESEAQFAGIGEEKVGRKRDYGGTMEGIVSRPRTETVGGETWLVFPTKEEAEMMKEMRGEALQKLEEMGMPTLALSEEEAKARRERIERERRIVTLFEGKEEEER